ncbi:unnamed protein product [Cyclocybe aegerita]|uniref:U3 small nucleolar RNA-associated protein 22 n=1 Tax=Cyclocybe aegerita TaxID=1973307 RepID=A0A8S0XQ22_CYCAE|nr:unnamed protein product [Cyclocybe aegerita]
MVQNLKRKRAEVPGPRKTQKVHEELPQVDINVDNGAPDGESVDSTSDREVDGDDELQAEEEWGGIEGSQAAAVEITPHPGTKPKKPPTGEELRAIKDASDLFKSSSFKLQIDALLPNVRPKASRIPPLERFLFALHATLNQIPSVPPTHPLEASRKLQKRGIAVPYSLPLPTEDTNWKVAFEPPSDITLVGSWANKAGVKAKDGLRFGVDLAVEMPNSLFQEKDYLNGRFFHKRSFYLANIAAAFRKSKSLNVDVGFESLEGDTRLTKLVLTPKNDDSQTDFTKLNAKVCILPTLSQNSPIPLHRLSPSHSNLRINSSSDAHDDASQSVHMPTPLYNNALLRTLTPKSYLLAVHTLQNDCPAFSDALTLLRIWANQRGFSEGTRMCVRGFEGAGPWWWSLLALLLNGEEVRSGATKANKRRSVGKGLSSYQLFKAALEFLAKHDFEKESIFVKTADGHRYSPEDYKADTRAVFVDSLSLVNLLAGVPLGSLDLLRYEASKTLERLNETAFSGDPFNGVFLKDCRDLLTRFDTILRVDISSAKPKSSSTHSTLDAGSPSTALLASMSSLLRQGLGDRSRAITILHPSSLPRSISQAHPSSPDAIFIGILHDPQNAFRLVDHGPAADEQDEAALQKFRDLWGEKAELRRFKDGRIVESVVWEVTTADERAHVPSMIVRHLLKRHFGLGEGAVETWQTSFDSVLRLPPSVSREYLASGASTGVKGALTAFDNLVKSIKKLDDDLPLSLLTVSPISEALRYTNVFSPVPLTPSLAPALPPNARYLAPIDIVLEFEKSSKWPDDLKAVQAIKLAFFERLASKLMESVKGLVAKVAISDGVHDSQIMDRSLLDIVTPEGWAFNARIWHDREVNLIDRGIHGTVNRLPHVTSKSKDTKKTPEYYEALEAKEVYMRRFIHAPRHHRAIAALSHHYTAFSGTVRLVKRWIASHWLLRGHVSEEVVELICASFFLNGGKAVTQDMDVEQTVQHLVPASKERAFSAVIRFLKEWKWEEGLFVPLYGSASVASDGQEKETSKAGGASVWKVSTEHDWEGRIWTHCGPDVVVAHRVRALAEATWKCLEGVESGQLDVQALFTHPTDDYDVLIQLDPAVLPRYVHNINAEEKLFTRRGKYANRMLEDQNDATVLPGFDPAQLLFNDLQRVYADTFKIFYDPLGGDKFGIVWDPTLKESRPFRVLGGFSSVPIKKENDKAKDKGLVTFNQEAVVAEIERLGTGLIKKITIRA